MLIRAMTELTAAFEDVDEGDLAGRGDEARDEGVAPARLFRPVDVSEARGRVLGLRRDLEVHLVVHGHWLRPREQAFWLLVLQLLFLRP